MNARRLPLHAICPYFAMFPESFVREYVEAYTNTGDLVFDPFCGRGTTILESLLLGRNAAGSDINPVAYCVSRAKAERPKLNSIISRLREVEKIYQNSVIVQNEKYRLLLPPFFRRAFYHTTLKELLFLRHTLDWKNNKIDRFIAALVIGSLHGEMGRSTAYFSNQMPRTICLKPNYSLQYWGKHELFPKKRRVFAMLQQKAEYRLMDIQANSKGMVRLADSRKVSSVFRSQWGKVELVITSPPYLNVTRYEEDQWLRLWFLGGPPYPTYGKISRDDRYEVANKYWKFIEDSWAGLVPLLKENAKIIVRLGAIGLNEEEMTIQFIKSVKNVFPKARLIQKPKYTEIVRRQAQSFLPSSKGCLYEIDYVLSVC
ncbi:MAG: DNA methylase [Spirochaetes bacterium]|nr:MAG: DNA methylase [Spirochaetota bacterium]